MTSSVGRKAMLLTLSLSIGLLSSLPQSLAAQRGGRKARTEAWRKVAPHPTASKPFTLPATREGKLDNGLTFVLIEDHRAPLVITGMGIRVGGVDDPPGQAGLAEATGDLITQGAGSRNAEDLAREVETMGGIIDGSAGDDYTQVEASVIADNADHMLEIIADVVLRPTFPESEVALYKNNRIQNLSLQRQEPEFLADECFDRTLFGTHPYAITSPTPEAVAALDRNRIESFYKSNYKPGGAVLVIAGDFDGARMEARTRKLFGEWRAGSPPGRSFAEMPKLSARRVLLVDRPGSEQADFRIGNLAVERANPDYYPLLLASTILGGGTSSRLFLSIRERLGYSYDVSSSVVAPRQRGKFFGASETRTEVTLPAIKEMLIEFARMRNLRVPATDLRNAKNYLNGVFSLTLSTQGGMAASTLQSRMLDLPKDSLEDYRSRIDSVTAEQVLQAARKYILTDRLAIVVVGDAARLAGPLSTLGLVEVIDIEGKPVKGAAISGPPRTNGAHRE